MEGWGVTTPEYLQVMGSRIDLFAIQRQADLPGELRRWLALSGDDVLESPWLIVPSAAMRQRLDWDVADCGSGDSAVSANSRYLFPEEFVSAIERLILEDLGVVRRDWRKESIAARLASLAGGDVSWSGVLGEASLIDEGVRWRGGIFDEHELPHLSKLLLASDEWRLYGPTTQRSIVLNGLALGAGVLPSSIALCGLENAPGGSGFAHLVSAVAQRSRVGIFTVYPRVWAGAQSSEAKGISWWRSIDEHLMVWGNAGVEAISVTGHSGDTDLDRLKIRLAGDEVVTDLINDGSVAFIGTVGASRQTEMVRDRILQLLEDGEAQPHQILVTSPSLETFSSHIERHWDYESFDADGERLPRLAFELVERSATGMRNRSRLLAALLDLVNNYVTVDQLQELLQFQSLTEGLGFASDDVDRLRILARQAHVIFGASHEQRAHLETMTSSYDVGTWRRFLDRLALTAMMPDNIDDVDQLGTGDDLSRIGAVRRVLEVIENAQASSAEDLRQTMGEWVDWATSSFGSVVERSGGRDDSLERAYERVREDFASTTSSARVSFPFFRDYWHELVNGGARAQTFGRFGVHVAPISALTAASYRFVFVLGLDEENFPASSLQSSLLTPTLPGDPNPRAAVLGSLLLCVNAASDGVTFSFNSRNELSGELTKRAVVLEELLERVGSNDVNLVLDGARHGFVQPTNLSAASISFDPRYRKAGDLIIDSANQESLLQARLAAMSQAASAIAADTAAPTMVTVKQLQRFLRNTAEHFVQRGLLGEAIERIATDEAIPRVNYDALTNYGIRLEIIERLAGLRVEPEHMVADELFAEIVGRETVARDIHSLFSERRFDSKLAQVAESYRFDRECYEDLSEPEQSMFYAPVVLESGRTFIQRLNTPDERRPWTVLRDYSSRHGGTPGCPVTVRFHPSKMDGSGERRDALPMIVDLLVMKVNQPPSDNSAPVATIFFANTGQKGGNPQVSYSYQGTREQALDALNRLVELYCEGLARPVAIGRHVTMMQIEGDDFRTGYGKDLGEPLFEMIFGDDARDFLQLSQRQGLGDVLDPIIEVLTRSRETATQRNTNRHLDVDPVIASKYFPVKDWKTHEKNAKPAKGAR